MKLNLFSLKANVLTFSLLLFSLCFNAQQVEVVKLTTTDGKWTVPCKTTSIKVEVWGAGGGGGRITEPGQTGGGGGGVYVKSEITSFSVGDIFAYHVGSGGSGGSTNNNGEDSWFSSPLYIMAKGGEGVGQNVTAGGKGGLASESFGDVKYSGGNGGDIRSGGKAGGGGGAANSAGNGGNAINADNGGGVPGLPNTPGGPGANGGGDGFGQGNNAPSGYGGGGGGAISWLGGNYNGGKGRNGYIVITYTLESGVAAPISQISALSTDVAMNNIGCDSDQVTLMASGGNEGAGVSTLWYQGTTCPTLAYVEEFMAFPTSSNVTNTTVGGVSSGNRTLSATNADPNINMTSVLSTKTISPKEYKYISIRYRVVAPFPAPINTEEVQIYIKNNNIGLSDKAMVKADLICDGDWHVMNINMSANPYWDNNYKYSGNSSAGVITGWRYDYAQKSGTKIEVDYLVLSNVQILENTSANDKQITLKTTKELVDFTSNIGAFRIADQAATCNNQVPVTTCIPVTLNRSDKTYTSANGNWNIPNNWSPKPTGGALPNETNCVKIPNNIIVNVDVSDAKAKSIYVDPNGKVSISAGNALTVTNSIINMGDGSNFIINDGGNLLQIEDGAVNTGNITAQKVFTFSTGRQQYNYVSSPTVNTNVKSIYTGVLDNALSALYYIESNDRFGTSGGNYIAGRALALKEKSTGTEGGTTGNPAKFLGVPFNGTIKYPLAFTNETHGYNLVGNPYPSNLDIENLYDYNAAKINATFYFWDNRGNTEFTQQGSGYNGDNYAKYNAVADTGVGSGVKARGISEANGRVPNRYVKVGTGFLVQAKSADQTLDFNNGMRNSDNSSPGFLGKSNQNGDKDRYWLTLKTPTEMEFMTAVVYLANGSKAIGPEDTETFGGSDDIFTVVDDKNLAIQGRDQFEDTDKLNLGLSFFNTGTYTISIYDKEGIFTNGQSIYLKDKFTGTITNLSQGSYTFETNKGVTEGRFEIIYKPETVLVTDSKVKDGIVVYRDSVNFVVQAPKIIATVEVYDLSGKLITVLKANTNQAVLNASFFNKGGYVLRIKTSDGEITNKKIMK